ncbi:MAG: efflux RND transporter periplasmic adaptor subunit [Candidatus Rokuibacteriota bacterium]
MPRVVFLLAAALAASACSRSEDQARAPAPVPVTVATVVEKPVPVQVRAIGNVLASNSVTVRSRVGGLLADIHFREGQEVREGELLFTIDRRVLEAELRQARANLAKSQAQLANARTEAERYARLVEQGFVARQQYDQVVTNLKALDATVNADRAVVENARIRLGYASIRAPISGRTGALQARAGDVVKPDDTALVVINRLTPIDVAFALPEQQLPDVQRYRAQETLEVIAVTPATGEPLARGELTFVDNRVDPATGTIQMKAMFSNDERTLWPGQYVNVVLTLTVDPAAVVVPTTAVQAGQAGRYVFVVKPDSTVETRPVAVAREVGPETVIARGVTPGETVVTDGQLRLFPGAPVEMKTATATAPAPPGR